MIKVPRHERVNVIWRWLVKFKDKKWQCQFSFNKFKKFNSASFWNLFGIRPLALVFPVGEKETGSNIFRWHGFISLTAVSLIKLLLMLSQIVYLRSSLCIWLLLTTFKQVSWFSGKTKLSIHKVVWLIFFQEMVFCCSSFFPWSVFGVFLVCVFPHLDWIRRHGLSLHILSKYGKMRTRITPNMDTFYTVIVHFVVLGVSLWQRAFSQME